MVDLPDGIRACLFDLDGVLTQPARIHAQARKAMFDDFLRRWAAHLAGKPTPDTFLAGGRGLALGGGDSL